MSLRLYFQHILRTLLCIGAMATLFCQQSHAVVIEGQEYFFIQFFNIDNENDSRFVRANWYNWPDPNGVALGTMQRSNEDGWQSDQVGFWRWEGENNDLLVNYYYNQPGVGRRYLCYNETDNI